ncbi:MAG: universal stress protein [Theionarchaea archaeon]|nr:universal stress protein [Theionarchaea archaeon]
MITSFDSALHHSVFTSLTGVLSEEAGKVFKFKEQENLHTLVIDQSLEDLYRGYLEKGKTLSREYSSKMETELLKGNPYDAVCKKVNEENPDLIIVGRHGMHRGHYEKIGSNAERIAELADTNVLVITTDEPVREQEVPTEAQPVISGTEKVEWTKEAQERLERIPSFARPMAVLAIERYAREKGITVITPEVMSKARSAYES